ncbi:hypothetical protein NCAS_0C03480 [Naumovozyma castellii]|uniref:Kinetochore protein Nuf2 N-terminal domain-containing protein n=1 Tax=Naumovozyma castellii TaxID=27288 RepID=G0VCX7_NAUCA|nr:hypothetical protein NCAS_0C03480 [Naumovozyma castellii CBS 4309]CCC69338.1 hypothetical protein NCAS_0C03480 [Naumovozyma castellii CBS 4309]
MSHDIFPILDLSELVICLQSCDFSIASEDQIARPISDYVITLYKQIIENFMGISVDSVLRGQTDSTNISRDGEGEEIEDENFNYMSQILILTKICYKFFQNIGVSDFTIMDLNKPEQQRTVRLLSAVINYARFREERMFDCNRFISQMESLLGQLRSKFDDYNLLTQQTRGYEEEINALGISVNDDGTLELNTLEENNKSLENQLKKLTQVQETLSINYSSYKSEKQKILKELESLGFELVELDSQKEKLEKYSKISLNDLTKSIVELSKLLKEKQESLATLKRRYANFQESTETFERVANELYDILRIISNDLQSSQRSEFTLREMQSQLNSNKDQVENVLLANVLMKTQVLQQQIQIQKDDLKDLADTHEQQSVKNKKRLDELHTTYAEEVRPKIDETETHIQNDLIEGEIKALEDDIRTTQLRFEEESDTIELEYSLLVGHINKYMMMMLEKMK